VPPISARHPDFTLADAYAVQREVRALELADGAVAAGHKIGATSAAIQKMFGIDHPDFGYLTDRMLLPDGVCLDVEEFIAPKVEGEIAFRMGADLAGGSVTADDVLAATARIYPVLEVLDSRIEDWDIRLVDTVADNASSAAVVIGAAVPAGGTDLAAERMVFRAGHQVLTGYGSAVLGHPAESVACLVRILAGYGTGLDAGDIVLAGAWAAAVDLLPGNVVSASFDSLGSVSLSVSNVLQRQGRRLS
jgi:2-keto-4-pentenoate hydratase